MLLHRPGGEVQPGGDLLVAQARRDQPQDVPPPGRSPQPVLARGRPSGRAARRRPARPRTAAPAGPARARRRTAGPPAATAVARPSRRPGRPPPRTAGQIGPYRVALEGTLGRRGPAAPRRRLPGPAGQDRLGVGHHAAVGEERGDARGAGRADLGGGPSISHRGEQQQPYPAEVGRLGVRAAGAGWPRSARTPPGRRPRRWRAGPHGPACAPAEGLHHRLAVRGGQGQRR